MFKTIHKKAIWIAFSTILYLSPQAIAQKVTEGHNLVPSAQEWSFMKYGNTDVNLFSGTLSLSIPVHTYEDPDFILPISLGYASNGYMPNIPAGPTGQGWYLNAAGMISREVRGMDDFEHKEIGNADYFGYYKTHTQGKPAFGDDLFSMGTKCDSVFMYKHSETMYSETEPDIFRFNFFGHKGTFRMGDGRMYIYDSSRPKGEYKIDMSNAAYANGNSVIKITTGDGYIYQFESLQTVGGHYKQFDKDKVIPPFTWYLTKITAPNQRYIRFQYNEPEITERVQPHAYHTYTLLFAITPDSWGAGDDTDSKAEQTVISQSVRQIKKITCDGLTVDFIYSDRLPEIYKTPSGTSKSLKTLKKLDEIKIKLTHEGKPVFTRNCRLGYAYSSSINPVMFLQNVFIDGQKPFGMTYYNMNELQPQGTTGIDHWGYCNNDGEYDPKKIIPDPALQNQPSVDGFGYGYRYSDPQKAVVGLLKNVAYPTGGTKEFIYESNDYADYLSRYSNMVVHNNSAGGGMRIKKIISYRSSTLSGGIVEKEYEYKMLRDGSQISSGILMTYPIYGENKFRFIPDYGTGIRIYCINSYNIPSNYSAGSPVIEYAQVKEKYPDGSSKIFYYNDYRNSPSISKTTSQIARQDNGPDFLFASDDAYELNRNHDRGQLIKLEQYNNNGNLVQREVFNYNLTRDISTIRFVKTGISSFINKCEDVSSSTLQSYVKTSYVNGTESQRDSVSFTYNTAGQIVKKTDTNSKGHLHSEYITHIHEKPSLSTDEQYMVNQNMLAAIWRTAQSVKNSNSKMFINAKRYTYKKYAFGSQTLVKLWKIENGIFYSTSSLDNLNYYPEVTYNKYSKKGRLLQTTDGSNVPTTYLWGYGDLYPVAVITNAALTTVSNKLGVTNLENTSNFLNGLTDSQETLLRTLPNTSVETYKYRPGVGITAKTDLSGRDTHYNYNSTYKLSQIIDEEGIIKSFSYSTDAN